MVTYGAVKGAPKGAFILTLDSPVSHFTIEPGTKRNAVQLSFVPWWSGFALSRACWLASTLRRTEIARIGSGRHDLRERSSYNGWRIGTSRPTCELATVSTARTARFLVPSDLPISPNIIATSVPPAKYSTMGASLSESCLQLHWNPQTLRCVCPKRAMH
jgi:hypothetical protein